MLRKHFPGWCMCWINIFQHGDVPSVRVDKILLGLVMIVGEIATSRSPNKAVLFSKLNERKRTCNKFSDQHYDSVTKQDYWAKSQLAIN